MERLGLGAQRRLVSATVGVLAVGLAAAGGVEMRLAVRNCKNRPGGESDIQQLARVVELRPGMRIAEIGAGEGGMAVGVARRLGPSGQVYATELEASQLRAIRKAASAAGMRNITVVQAGEHSTALAEACCDLIYMRRVYHHLTDPTAIDRSLLTALRPGGRLVVIDLLVEPWMLARRHGIAKQNLIAQLTTAGFLLERQADGWSMLDYCVVFRKPPPGEH